MCGLPTVRALHRWLAPSEGVFKINTDASVNDSRGCGLGMVIQNWKGEVMVLGSHCLCSNLQVDEAEAAATVFGLTTALEMGFNDIILEFDSLVLEANMVAHGLANYAFVLEGVEQF
ncbi:hypothetical protein P3X46_032308 [Hevea brasiliensis]|uniref:RNase H type-1 domain-containing protein n=1 Tax=Hevea brasiliensis TaxID=3981 RepID=A0ABQ9KE26_HEVBR|nr:hypothetical protein P3X46_032308 [Hevea brasiliensis]